MGQGPKTLASSASRSTPVTANSLPGFWAPARMRQARISAAAHVERDTRLSARAISGYRIRVVVDISKLLYLVGLRYRPLSNSLAKHSCVRAASILFIVWRAAG